MKDQPRETDDEPQTGTQPTDENLERESEEDRVGDDAEDEASKDSFPASDPPSF